MGKYEEHQTAMQWRRFNGEPIQHDIVQEVEQLIIQERALGNRLKVCIGTDSQVTILSKKVCKV
jgi:hypothetical protein